MTERSSSTEVVQRAAFSRIRYAQVWEDADVLLGGLAPKAGARCLSIASAGDNALAMLTADPAEVVAVDMNPAQLACVELRKAAFRCLHHRELLELMGARAASSEVRQRHYAACREALPETAQVFWDAHAEAIAAGIGGAGKFERYFALFRGRALPLVHSRRKVRQLLTGGERSERQNFYDRRWNTWRWRGLFHVFFSRQVMGLLGRSPAFFRYVEGSVAARILDRTRHALVELGPAENPYLHWILTGTHGEALPLWLRPENFELIRQRIDRLKVFEGSIEDYLTANPEARFDAFNLSDIFEYMSEENYHTLLARLIDAANPGARLAYWNMLVPRSRPESMSDRIENLAEMANVLHLQDKAFFYSRFVVERVRVSKGE